ncbi:phosphoglycerate mutase [Sulfolobus acidocaldarius SUSAZ]|nr:phosphoglycerate mutase [Sulfolobus acidocaldarius SUSAZ]
MTVIVFIRHAQSNANTQQILSDDINSYPLTDEGQRQAKKAVDELRKIIFLNFSKIYTSPILRAYQTASILSEGLNLVTVIDDRLKERRLGELNNKKVNMIELMKKIAENRSNTPKDLESWDELTKRIINFTETVLSTRENAIVVSHHDPIKSLITYVLDLDEFSGLGVILPNASMTILKCFNQNVKDCRLVSIGALTLTNEILMKLKS